MATTGDPPPAPPSGGVHITVGAYDGAVLGLALNPAAIAAAAARGRRRRRPAHGASRAIDGGGGGSSSSRGAADGSSHDDDDEDDSDDCNDSDDSDDAGDATVPATGDDSDNNRDDDDDDELRDMDDDGDDPPVVTLTTRHALRAHFDGGAGSVVRAVAASGRYAASAGDDGRLALYDTVGGVSLGELPCEAGPVRALAWAGGSAAAATATPTPTTTALGAAATSSAAHPTHLLAGSEAGGIAVWRVGGWVCERVLAGHTGAVTAIAVHPTAAVALSVAADRRLILWDLVKGERVFWTVRDVGEQEKGGGEAGERGRGGMTRRGG